MSDLIALKFHALLHTEDNKVKGWKNGHAKYPDFNQVSAEIRNGMDWCCYIDAFGIGMQYDKTCGHAEANVDSPFGKQLCVIAVPANFADEALALFPEELTELTPAEFEAFYDNKAHVHEPVELVDKDVLEAIAQKEKLSLPVPEKIDAVDPETDARGIRKNHNKVWGDKKIKNDMNIIDRSFV